MSTEIYVHIPFCLKKCRYCDFLSFSKDESMRKSYTLALLNEIKEYSKIIKDGVSTIYIGGGTPSFMNSEDIGLIINEIYKGFKIEENPEITIECNPNSLTEEKLSAYRDFGINRLSLGMQSLVDSELETLGRAHNSTEFYRAYNNALKAGFNNISVDIMYGLPGQSRESALYTVNKVVELNPAHISMYSLIIEEGTEFYRLYADEDERRREGYDVEHLPNEDDERAMYYNALETFEKSGYRLYELSNLAREGMVSRHNSGYWKRENYLGLGLGASSLYGNRRYSNIRDLKTYISKCKEGLKLNEIIEEEYFLSREDEISEEMFLGLRLTEGVNILKVNEKYNIDICKYFEKEIVDNINKGLLIKENNRLFLSKKGLSLANIVMKDFL